MNPKDPTLPSEHLEPTPEERRDAEALKAYLDGSGNAPGEAEAGVVGLLLSARPALNGSTPISLTSAPIAALRRNQDRPGRLRHGIVFSLAAAAVLTFFLWPQSSVAPAGATPELHARAVAALASSAPIGERLAALHALAGAARERLVYDMNHGGSDVSDARAAKAGMAMATVMSP